MGRKSLEPSLKKKARTFAEKYPIKYYVGNIPIRECNVISIYIKETDMVRIATIAQMSDMSVAKIMAFSGKPCEACKDNLIECTHKGQQVLIPRGLMSINKMESGFPLSAVKRKHVDEQDT